MPDYRALTRRSARRYGLDENIFLRQINAESGFNPKSGSSAGAQGIAQIMPATARAWGVDPHDSPRALDAAAKHMAQYVKKYGSYEKALRAYNAGEGAIDKSHGYSETNNYVNKILNGRDPGARAATAATTTKGNPGRPASTQTDISAALTDALLHRKSGRGLLAAASAGVDSGAYTTTTEAIDPTADTTKRAPGPRAAAAASPGKKGTAKFEGTTVAGWIAPILTYARSHGWKGSVGSGFRTFKRQTEIYNSGVRPAARPGTSNHEGADFPRGAIDVSDAAALSAILKRSPYGSKLVWAGSKDPVHFSHPHNGSY